MKPIYLDYNATTPIATEVAEAMLPYLQEFGNPSSEHAFGRRAKAAVDLARRQVATLINCRPEEIYFTSGGSESNNWALKGRAALFSRGRIITSQIEHPAILNVCKYLGTQGIETTFLPVNADGVVDLPAFENALASENIALVSVMHANNEVGSIQPVGEIAAIAGNKNIIVHTDAAQSIGKIQVDVRVLGVDLLSLAGHKLYAPKGIGALFCREGTALENLIHGAGHERGRRAGTENVLLIIGLGKACELARNRIEVQQTHVRALRDYLQATLQENLTGVIVNGHNAPRLPNTLSISIRGVQSQNILYEIEDRIACSAGSACHAGEMTISPVLQAMRISPEYAGGTLRLSLGVATKREEVEIAAQMIIEKVKQLRG